MKFVIFGLTISSSWGNGHATLWRGLCRALIQRGHSVTFFEHDVSYYAQHRDLNELPGGELALYTNWNELLPRAIRELAGADVGMVTSYCPDGIAATQLVLDSGAKLKTFYDLDTPVTLDTLSSGKELTYIGERGLRDFDLVLSYTGGVALAELEMRLGARRVAPLYGHVDPEVHRPVAPREDWRCDLSYLGTYAEDRQATLEGLFIEPARRLADKKFLIGGAQYPAHFPWTRNVFFVQHLPPADHPAFFCSGRMTLNITRRAMAQMGYCPSGRLFEAAACGCPLLSDTWPGLETFFTPGEEILTANATEDAMKALQLSDAELKCVAEAARERTLREHTSEQRAIYLERVIEDALAGSKSPGLEVPACSDTESGVPGTTAIREVGAESTGGNRLHQTHDSDRGSVTCSAAEHSTALRLTEPRSEMSNVASGSSAQLQVDSAVPPHPGPLPEGEGTECGRSLMFTNASREPSAGQADAPRSESDSSREERNSFLPLPKEEERVRLSVLTCQHGVECDSAVPSHPGPLPEGEGTAGGRSSMLTSASCKSSAGQADAWNSESDGSRDEGHSFLPLPKGEGRGEGEARVIQSSHVTSPTNSAQAIGSREHPSQLFSPSLLTSAATKQEFVNRHS